jgi:cyclic AMP-dependent transcription factor ATF-4
MTPQPDIAHELAVVDELVRTRVEDMQWSSSGPSSPNSSGSSNFGDCSSDDPEWMPEPNQVLEGVDA